MIACRLFSPSILVKSVAAINIVGNLIGVTLTFIYFAILIPRLSSGAVTGELANRTGFFVVVMLFVMAIVGPVNSRWVWRLTREVKERFRPDDQGNIKFDDVEGLRLLAGKLLKLPVKLAGTTLAAWIIAAGVVSAAAHAIPNTYPWPHDSSHKISAWMVLVAAPITTCCIYFSQERWLRLNIRELFPPDALHAVPPTPRINVLPRLLVVCLLVGTVPLVMVGHLTIHHIRAVKLGQESIENFLLYMPDVIWFLIGVFIVLAVGLSIYLAKSVSEPLQSFESVMKEVRTGDLDAHVPVVSNDEIGQLGAGFNLMVHDLKQVDTIKETFGRYLSKEVVDEILKSPGGVALEGELRHITILVSDLRGFTRLTESLEPRRVLEIINRYFEQMTDIIIGHGGTIDEFTGDGILVFFGAPQALPDHSRRAVRCALDMQQAMEGLNGQFVRRSLPELKMGIGISSGQLIVGNIGSEKRKKYGALGSPINLAFRIEAHTAGGEILVSPSVYGHVDGEFVVDQARESRLKGLDDPIVLYRVVGLSR